MTTTRIGNLDVRDLRGTLPRHPTRRYAARRLDDIAGIAVHHTGPPAHRDLSAQEIARYHVEHNGWPAIAYDWLVHWDGTVEYVKDWTEAGYHVGGANNALWLAVCLTGDWSDGRIPGEAQLAATRELIANVQMAWGRWLPVKGHRELGASACPGDTWPRWRERVTPVPTAAPPDELAQLRAENSRLQAELAAARQARVALKADIEAALLAYIRQGG